ncbi:transposase [Mycoplasma sp. Z244C]
MSRKQFTIEQKLKYIKLTLLNGIEYAKIQFVEDFWEERYKDTYLAKTKKHRNVNPYRYADTLIKRWIKIYNTDMKKLVSQTGKSPKKGKNSGRPPKRRSINEFDEHDRDLYQEIMEEILEDHGINPNIILQKIKEKKEKNKSFHNNSLAASIFHFNRTSVYSKYEKAERIDRRNQYLDDTLIDWLKTQIKLSNNVIGRDKLYHKYIYETGHKISSYAFRINFESLDYKSNAYRNKSKDKPPKEEKYHKVWAPDRLQGNFTSSYFGEILHADIKYVKINGVWHYLHVITETYSDVILDWSLSTERTAESSIKLLQNCIQKNNISPQIFHSDHGIEYANNSFKNYLNSLNISQSMSPKGNSLRNRPSEFLFAIFQRELFDFYNTNELGYEIVYNLINSFVVWYNTGRPQRNLEYKTPYEYSNHMVLSV